MSRWGAEHLSEHVEMAYSSFIHFTIDILDLGSRRSPPPLLRKLRHVLLLERASTAVSLDTHKESPLKRENGARYFLVFVFFTVEIKHVSCILHRRMVQIAACREKY